MNKLSRTQYSIRNIFFGVSGQAIDVLFRFINRTIFIKFLSVEYLGINSLFTEILTVLSLAELGIGSAIAYALYKPLAEDDKEKISALMNFYKKCYIGIGICVTVLGLLMLPFLDIIVKKPDVSINIYLAYCLFLFDTSISYFYSYKTSLLNADQKNYITQVIKAICSLAKTLLQIAIIIITKNFYLYIVVQLIMTFISNILVSRYVDINYPYLKNKGVKKLDNTTLCSLKTNIKALVVIKLSGILVNSTDNIIISFFNGVKSVGKLSNYTLIVQVFERVLNQVFDSLTGSIGNLNAEEDNNKSENFFKVLNLANFWLYGWVAIFISVLGNHIIKIWIGENYLLSQFVVYIISCNFYIKGMQNAVWNYKNTFGLFNYGKYLLVFTAIINLVLSIGLGSVMGEAGILLATSISRLCTNVWYEPYAVYKYGLKSKVINYYITYVKYIFIVIISLIITLSLSDLYMDLGINNQWIIMLYKIICVVIIPNIIILLCIHRTKEFKYIINKLKDIIGNKRAKKKDINNRV